MTKSETAVNSPERPENVTGIIVHEWIEQAGGAEKVLRAMADTYQDAPVLALWSDARDNYLTGRLRETWLARTKLRRNKALALPFMLAAWRNQAIEDADWALVSSHLFAHHVRFKDRRENIQKFVYVHTPARYIWEPSFDRRGSHVTIRAASRLLQSIDRKRASEGAQFAANSQFVKDRIQRTWGQEARVIHPPVAVSKLQAKASCADELNVQEQQIVDDLPNSFVLAASRFVPYKRLEAAVRVAEANGVSAVIAGSGPDEARLRALAANASIPVHFIIQPSDTLLMTLYQKCLAYVFAAVEDFGIMPVEAMAFGTPVICGNIGGVLETVEDGVTGVHLHSESPNELKNALEKASSLRRDVIRNHALRFDTAHFEKRLAEWTGKTPVKLHSNA